MRNVRNGEMTASNFIKDVDEQTGHESTALIITPFFTICLQYLNLIDLKILPEPLG
jgi:hypothetical protein